ncbi:putative ribonuclease H-like domain-containing protein [Tanacetum coccineum]
MQTLTRTKELDAELVTFGNMALTENEEDDWSIRELCRTYATLDKMDLHARRRSPRIRGGAIIDSRLLWKYDMATRTICLNLKAFKVVMWLFRNDPKGEESRKRNHKTSCIDFEKVNYWRSLLRVSSPFCFPNQKGKQHRASCKKIEERTVREPLELLHMDLFGPVSVESVNRKKYCLVVTNDCSKFGWVFFLAYKDDTYDMLHDLIVGLENKLRHKVKTIRCDHGPEFKNH